ncbi:hypothetical protein RCL1_006459 [Eukaryota sp. TZLM3-RCL]
MTVSYSLLLLSLLLLTASCTQLVFTSVESPKLIPSNADFQSVLNFEVTNIDSCTEVHFIASIGDLAIGSVPFTLCPNVTTLSATISPIHTSLLWFNDITFSCTECVDTSSISAPLLVIPGYFTLIPSVITIVLAATTHQVIPSLLIGIFSAAFFTSGTLNPLEAFKYTVGKYLVDAISDHGHAALSAFFIFLGAIIGMISKSGGSQGLARIIAKVATTSKLAQCGLLGMTWMLWFDEFTNVLLSGLALQPLLAKMKVSPEKMSFILDSMGSSPTSIFIVTSWVGFELALIKEELLQNQVEYDSFMFYLESIPYAFYPIMAIIFVAIIVLSGRDFGPMYTAEVEAKKRSSRKNNATSSSAGSSDPALTPDADKPLLAMNAILPILVTIGLVLLFILITGKSAIMEKREEIEILIEIAKSRRDYDEVDRLSRDLDSLVITPATLFSSADPYLALLYGISLGVLTCFVLMMRIGISFGKSCDAFIAGFKDISSALLILWCAWALGGATNELKTAHYLGGLIPDNFPPVLLITALYIIGCIVSFSCGSTWGAFVILIPLSFALVHGAYPNDLKLLKIALGAVFSGSLFGNHASPLADCSIVAAIASKCELMAHVRSQMPYCAFLCGLVLFAGYLPVVLFNLDPFICILIMIFISLLVVFKFGKKVPVYRAIDQSREDLLDDITPLLVNDSE